MKATLVKALAALWAGYVGNIALASEPVMICEPNATSIEGWTYEKVLVRETRSGAFNNEYTVELGKQNGETLAVTAFGIVSAPMQRLSFNLQILETNRFFKFIGGVGSSNGYLGWNSLDYLDPSDPESNTRERGERFRCRRPS